MCAITNGFLECENSIAYDQREELDMVTPQ